MEGSEERMKKLPYGISDYERLIRNDYNYVDKTEYIEKMEGLSEPYLIFLRPRKFGKTLFTSMIANYYDIKKQKEFKELYEETYIGKNPTKLKNSYYVLKFNFSGIDTATEESTIKGFKNEVLTSIDYFTKRYNVDFYVNYEQEAENVLDSLFKAFDTQKNGQKIYTIIDEYDHFANELLGFNTEQFKNLVSKNGKVRKWYEILKKGTETVVDRIFVTGVAPITLDSLTSGFNIGKDITQDEEFNEMMGFTKSELEGIMNQQEINKENQKILFPILKENYNGYKFSAHGKEKVYNSNMCLYFLNDYTRLKRIPEKLIDVNIASDYTKLGKMLSLCEGKNKLEILKNTIAEQGIITDITQKFNPAMKFTEKDLVSMLYYLGYLTIVGEQFEKTELKIPNKVMKEIYSDYFIEILSNQAEFRIEERDYNKITEEIALETNY